MSKESKELTQMGVLDCAAKTHVEDLGIKSADKLILLTLCMHINRDVKDGYWCNPSHALLEQESGYSKRKLSNSITTLQDTGYIKSVASKYSNTYYINAALIVEKHNLWRQSFKGDAKIADNPFGTVSSSATKGFESTTPKKHSHVRDTSGLYQGTKKPVAQPSKPSYHSYQDDEEIEPPF